MNKFSSKTLISFSFFMYALGSLAVYFANDITVIIVLSSFIGILYTAFMTVPYKMLADFHKCERYTNQEHTNEKRGLGKPLSLSTFKTRIFSSKEIKFSFSNRYGLFPTRLGILFISDIDSSYYKPDDCRFWSRFHLAVCSIFCNMWLLLDSFLRRRNKRIKHLSCNEECKNINFELNCLTFLGFIFVSMLINFFIS